MRWSSGERLAARSGRDIEVLVLFLTQPRCGVREDHAVAPLVGDVGSGAVQCPSQPEQDGACGHLGGEDLVRCRLPIRRPAVASGDQERRSVLGAEVGDRPHRGDDQVRPRQRKDREGVFLSMQHLGACARRHVQRGGHVELVPIGSIGTEEVVAHGGHGGMQDQLADLPGSGHEGRHALGERRIERGRIVVGLDRSGLHVRSELGDQPAPCWLIGETGHDQTASVTERGRHVVERVRSRVSRYRDHRTAPPSSPLPSSHSAARRSSNSELAEPYRPSLTSEHRMRGMVWSLSSGQRNRRRIRGSSAPEIAF